MSILPKRRQTRPRLRGRLALIVIIARYLFIKLHGLILAQFLVTSGFLHQRFGRAIPPRFFVAANAAQRQRLLAPLQLHRVFKLMDDAPPEPDHWLTLGESEPARPSGAREQLGRHVLECHRHLADLGGANEDVFGPIIEQLLLNAHHVF